MHEDEIQRCWAQCQCMHQFAVHSVKTLLELSDHMMLYCRYRGYERRKARGPSEHERKKLEEKKAREAQRQKLVVQMYFASKYSYETLLYKLIYFKCDTVCILPILYSRVQHWPSQLHNTSHKIFSYTINIWFLFMDT